MTSSFYDLITEDMPHVFNYTVHDVMQAQMVVVPNAHEGDKRDIKKMHNRILC